MLPIALPIKKSTVQRDPGHALIAGWSSWRRHRGDAQRSTRSVRHPLDRGCANRARSLPRRSGHQ
jgi:hypothetical protein